VLLLGLLFAVVAMVLNSVAGLMQADATRYVTPGRPLVSQWRYLIGLLVDGLGWVCTIVALRSVPVFAVQAVLGGAIVLTAVGSRLAYGSTLRRVDRWAAGACTVGLVLVAASAGAERPETIGLTTELMLAGVAGLLAVGLVAGWHSGRGWVLSVVGGLGFGGTSLAIRAVDLPAGANPLVLLGELSVYLVLVFWAIGLTAYSRALGVTGLARVTAVVQVTEVIAPGLVGIVLLGDTVRSGLIWWGVLGVGLVAAVAGVAVIAGSPALQPPSPVVHRH
jgi:hypothetical protein